MALFSRGDLATYLHKQVSEQDAQSAERMASGWLKGATGAVAWPSPPPDDLWAWAVELGALAHDNPRGLASDQQTEGPFTNEVTWARNRKEQILAEVRASRYVATAATGPRGVFPLARPWPDPVERDRCRVV